MKIIAECNSCATSFDQISIKSPSETNRCPRCGENELKWINSTPDASKTPDLLLNSNKTAESPKDFVKTPNGSSIKVEDIYLPLNHLFTQATKKAFEVEVKHLLNTRKKKVATDLSDLEVVDQVRFLGAKAIGERNIFDAAKKVANGVNDLADRGFVTGVLAKLVMLELATEPHELPRYIVLSYPCLSQDGVDYVDTTKPDLLVNIGSSETKVVVK